MPGLAMATPLQKAQRWPRRPELNSTPGVSIFSGWPGQPAVELAVVQQPLGGHRAVQHAQQILRRDAVAGLVIEHRHDRRAVGDEGADDHDFGHGVVGAAGVAGKALGAGQGREEHDGVAAELDVVAQVRFLRIGQGAEFRIELERPQLLEVDRERFLPS